MEKIESYELTQNETGITATSITVAAAEPLQELWKFQVPVGMSYLFSGSDIFSCYLYSTTGGAEASAASRVQIVTKDSSQFNARNLLNQIRYTIAKEFQDVKLMCHLDIPPGEIVEVKAGEWIIVLANITNTLTTASSYFRLTCKRKRNSML